MFWEQERWQVLRVIFDYDQLKSVLLTLEPRKDTTPNLVINWKASLQLNEHTLRFPTIRLCALKFQRRHCLCSTEHTSDNLREARHPFLDLSPLYYSGLT